MKNVEEAISEYTDSITGNIPLPIESFAHEMSSDDFVEFTHLAHLIDLLFQNNQQERDRALFRELNQYKNNIYHQPKTVNFRTEKGDASQEAIDNLQKLFDEEFSDE